MAYPVVASPYGLKPINLIGGQVFAGSTRSLPIQYGYATSIFYGDIVSLARGFINRLAVTSAGGSGLVGVFLGCSYTNPVTKQKTFSQYWPSGTLAGDAVAIVADDPDTVFQGVVCSATTTVGAAALAVVGQNLQMIDNATGNVNTGDSLNAIQALSGSGAPATTAAFPLRVVGLVPESAYAVTGTGSSSSTTITLTGSGLSGAVLAGADIAYIASNGQLVETGSYVQANVAAGGTTVLANVAPLGGAIPSGSTIVFTTYPEVKVKLNFGAHEYYVAQASA
jgi:hypothetical protein